MAAATVDVGYLAASYSVPEPTLQSLLSGPTVELVQSLLVQIEAKAREYDELKSEKLRSDVELENAIHEGETRQRALKASADKALKEVEELRQKLSQEGKCATCELVSTCADIESATESARDQVETELQNIKSAASSSTSEVQALQSRIKTLEAQNRETIALHEAKSAAHDRLAEDLSSQHQKFVNLRKQVSELEEKNQSLENAATTTKYREQNLQQEIEMLKKGNEWFEGELNTRTADNVKFRKEKNAQIAELQRANADANQTIDSLRRTDASQRQRLEELEQKMEETLTRIQQLQEEAAQNQQSFNAELESTRRLATLHQESANTARAHLQEVRAQLAQTNDSAAQEVGQLQAEVDSERNQKEAAENRIAELESQIEGLESQISDLQNSAQIPSTPRRGGLKGLMDTPGRAGSPGVFSPGGSKIRGGLSTTQLYYENTELKKEVRSLKEKVEKGTATLKDMMDELESRQPEFDQLKQENDQLTIATMETSALLEDAMADREAARKEARKAQGDLQGSERERKIQLQQLRDLSFQIKVLVLQQQIREQGMESLTEQQRTYLRQIESTEWPEEVFEEIGDMTDTGRLISQHLVRFKEISELQNQNRELLRTIREVGERYEGSEAQARANQIEEDHRELTHLRERISQYEEEVKSLNLRSQSLTKERDMFRRIVTSRGQAPTGPDSAGMFGQSMNGMAATTPPPGIIPQSVEQTPRTTEIAGYEKLIKDLQAHLDAIREESATDRTSLKNQADRLAKESNQLQTDNMRLNNQVQLAQDRYDLQQNKLSLLQSENNELKKRCENLQDTSAKQDMRTQQVAEELVEAKSLAESLERENANLKASRDMLKTIETRLENDNKALIEERGRLNKMISDLQNLRNEHELVESENQRRLQTRTESLEAELQTVKRKLDDEVDDHKKAVLLYENEQNKQRNTIDDLRKVLNNIRPELASVKTERDQLQTRVNELKVELRLIEERGQNLNPPPTLHVNGSGAALDDDISREEQLSVEIASLKQELVLAREEVASANIDIDRYRAIAEDAERQLEGVTEAQEEYQQEMDRVFAEKDAKIRDLEQRVEEISSELASTNTELSDLRRAHAAESDRIVQQKEQLELEMTRIRDEADRYKETADLHKEDLKAQAEIATRAQQNYENELMKHSEAMKNLQREREQHNQLKTEVSQFKAQAEAARASLAQSDEHWTETRERYERELTEARTKFADLEDQNKILHQQLENVSTQIAGLKQSRVSVAGGDSEAVNSPANVEPLQEVVKYLRREKEILDVQYELSIQENKRMKQQLDHVQNQLDQTRERLNVEQQSQAQNKQSTMSLDAYEQTVAQLNTYRESNTTLRNQARQAEARLEEKKKAVDELYNQIQPLQDRVQNLETELLGKVGELNTQKENSEHWQKRYHDVLHKYDRIDPAELEALNAQITTLTTERDQAQEQINSFEERLVDAKKAAVDETAAGYEERRLAMISQFKERSRKISAESREKDSAIQNLTKERDEARQQLAFLQQELDTTRAARDEAVANANTNANTNANPNVDTIMTEEGQVDEGNDKLSGEERQALEGKIAAAESRAVEESNRAAALDMEVQNLQSKIRELENQAVSLVMKTTDSPHKLTSFKGELHERIADLNTKLAQEQDAELQQRIADLNTQLTNAREQARQAEDRANELEAQVSSAVPAAPAAPVQSSEDIEKLREELASAQKEVEDLRTRVEMAGSSVDTSTEEGTVSTSEQIAQQVAAIKAELEAKSKEHATAADQKATQRNESMKKKLNERLKAEREEFEEKIRNLKSAHEAETERIKSENQAEIERLRKEGPSQTLPVPSNDSTTESLTAETKPAVKVEGTAPLDLTNDQVTALVQHNDRVKGMIRQTVLKQMAPQIAKEVAKLKEQHAKEIEELKAANAKELEELRATHAKQLEEIRATSGEGKSSLSPEDLNKQLDEAKAKAKHETELLWKSKHSLVSNRGAKLKAQIDVVEQAAKETPQRPVGEVWQDAKVAKPAPAVQPPKPSTESKAAQPTTQTGQQGNIAAQQPLSNQAAFSTPGQQPGHGPQPNGATGGTFGQSAFGQPSFGQSGQAVSGTFGRPSNSNQPFQPLSQGLNQNRPTMANQGGQLGFSGLAQPGFMGGPNQVQQENANTSRPNSPFNQPPAPHNVQPQQGGRGRGHDNVGTGPAALRSLVGQNQGQAQGPQGNQSSIPRGGGIPVPSGRGRGHQQNPPNSNQGNVQGHGASQIGRGGGRGGRGGRGGGNISTNAPGGQSQGQGQGQNSPRQLNASAPGFQPGLGRGQKRGREEGGEGDAAHQGGKRARGGGAGSAAQ